jgi:hypothetical protein
MKVLISDCHAGCQLWQMGILQQLGYEVVINSFSGHSFLIDEGVKQNVTPYTKSRFNISNITPIISPTDRKNVMGFDTIISSFPPKFIDLYKTVKLKYPKILNVGHRLHIHTKNDPSFVSSLIDKVNNKELILCSMSKYDTEYIRHYTGITPIELYVTCFHIPSSITYMPTRNEILISPVHAHSVLPFESITHMNKVAAEMQYPLTFSSVKSLYPHYKYEDLVNHRATVLFPYSVFSISMIELYELNIPMFVPSKELLMRTGIMNDVSLFPLYGSMDDMLRIDKPHDSSPHNFSPNSLNDEDKRYWVDFAYFNTKENIIFWDSPLDLFQKLTTTNFQEVSDKMRIENAIHREKQLGNWQNLFSSLN